MAAPSIASSEVKASEIELMDERLGRGASAHVQLARLRSSSSSAATGSALFVALKIVDTQGDDKGAPSVALQRLLHEQEILRQLRHPGVIRLSVHCSDSPKATGTAVPGHFACAHTGPAVCPTFVRLGHVTTLTQRQSVLSLCPHGDLGLRLRHHARRMLPRATVRTYMAELVAALGYVHSRGIRHRDLSARNVLMDAEGHLVLADFGMATMSGSCGSKQAAGATGTCSAAVSSSLLPFSSEEGSIHYLSPERVHGGADADTPAADWFALGALMFEMLFGVTPFNGNDAEVREQLRAYKGPAPLRSFPPLDDADTIDLLNRLLDPDPRTRLGSAVSNTTAADSDETSKRLSPIRSDVASVRAHAYFRDVDWGSIEAHSAELWSRTAPSFDPQLSVLIEHED
jgi:serine/threonine protein kinase